MITPEDILEVMGKQVRGICEKVYPQERPNAVTEGLTEFIVVSLPYSVSNKILGEDDDWWIDLTVVYEIYVADKKKASNPKEFNLNKMKPLREQLFATFPVTDKENRFVIARPRTVVIASSDGNGYHYTRVQARLTTMV